jgi:hypothetical protein
MKNKVQNTKLNILTFVGNFFILLLNACGTLIWIHLYESGRYTEWWTIGLVIICGITAINASVNLWKKIREFFL